MTNDEPSSDIDVGDDDVTTTSTSTTQKDREPLNRAEQISEETALNIKSILSTYLANIGVSGTTVNALNTELSSLIENHFESKNTPSAVPTPTPVTANTAPLETHPIDDKFDGSTLELLAKLKSIYSVHSDSRFKGRKRFARADKQSFTYTHSTVVDQQLESSNAVQITANKDVLKRRIDTFISKKRLENSDFNTREFRSDDRADVNDSARTYPLQESKIKVTNTTNEEGPLVISEQERERMKYQPYVQERLDILENHIGILPPIPNSIYDRLKVIEDKILEIETKDPIFFKQLYENRQKSNIIIHHK